MAHPSVPLVGRASELATVRAAVQAARDGRAAGIVLSGDAGVGKTRLLTELTQIAAADGFLTLIGHCVDLGDTPPPYLPFTEAFRRLVDEQPELAADLTDRFPAVARLLPGRAESGPEPVDRVERGELFDSVRGALAHLADTRPVALFVEDVHWADQATRDLLGYLFTRLDGERLAVVVSYRSDDLHRRHPLRRTLAEWSRLPAVTRVALEPLGGDDLGALVREMLAAADLTGGGERPAIDDAAIADVVRRADGNAFFAEELLAAVAAGAGPGRDGDALPWQLADLLLVRLDRLSDDARQVVRVAAVAGRRVSHDVLEAAAAMPPAELEAGLRDAVDAHVLQLTSSGRGYVFRHALLAEAVYDDLLPGERSRLHAAYAAVLAADPDHRAAELARHAAASHDLDTAYTASLAAGDEAMTLAAPREALQHFEAALELAPRVTDPTSGHPNTHAVVLDAVEAAIAAGVVHRGARLADRALRDLPADAPAVDRATLLSAVLRATLAGEFGEDLLTTSAEALHLLAGEPPSPLHAGLLALHGRILYGLGHEADAEKALLEAVAEAETVGSPRGVTEARASLGSLERRKGDPEQAARLLADAAEQARRGGDYASELRSWFSLASLWHELCRLDDAQRTFVRAHRRAVETGREWDLFGVHARAMTATVQYIRGEWDAALETLDTSRERPPKVAEAILRSTALTVRAGRGDEGVLDELPSLDPYWSREGRIGLYAAFAALEVHEQQAEVDAALALIDNAVRELGRLWLEPWFLGRIQLSSLGLAVLCAAAATSPAARHAALVAQGEQLLADGRRSAAEGLPNTRELGREGVAWLARLEAEALRLRWLTGQNPPTADELVTAWQSAVERFDFGHAPQQARSRARLAEALRAGGRSAEATAAADAARAAAQQLGAEPLLAAIRALGSARRTGPDATGFGALTDREREVLAELVDGRSNRQIAAKLYISEKTASVHVSNILGKLGVGSRAEAAALARRDGFRAPAARPDAVQ